MKSTSLILNSLTILTMTVMSLLSSCAEDKQTKIFSEYMMKEFQTEIPSKLTYYLYVPENIGCHSCNAKSIDYFCYSKDLKRNSFLITSKKNLKGFTPNLNENFLIESNIKLEDYNLKTQNATIITVEDKKIKNIQPITPDNLNEVLNILKN